VDRLVIKTMVIRRRRTAYQAAVSERVEDDVFRSPKAHEIRRQNACVTNALRTTHSTRLYFAVEISLLYFRIAI